MERPKPCAAGTFLGARNAAFLTATTPAKKEVWGAPSSRHRAGLSRPVCTGIYYTLYVCRFLHDALQMRFMVLAGAAGRAETRPCTLEGSVEDFRDTTRGSGRDIGAFVRGVLRTYPECRHSGGSQVPRAEISNRPLRSS